MKRGQVWKSPRGNGLDDLFYLVIEDYGVFRPLNLNGICENGTNMAAHCCPKSNTTQQGFYQGDVKVADSLIEFYAQCVQEYNDAAKPKLVFNL